MQKFVEGGRDGVIKRGIPHSTIIFGKRIRICGSPSLHFEETSFEAFVCVRDGVIYEGSCCEIRQRQMPFVVQVPSVFFFFWFFLGFFGFFFFCFFLFCLWRFLTVALCRSYFRATKSPLFPRETELEKDTLERFIDLLPTIQTHLKKGTKKDLQAEVRNSICNAWMSILLTKEEIEFRESAHSELEEDEWFFYIGEDEDVNLDTGASTEKDKAEEELNDEEEVEEEEEKSEDVELNERKYDRRLAARRARRKVRQSTFLVLALCLLFFSFRLRPLPCPP